MEESDDAQILNAWRTVEEATKRCEDHGSYESSLMAHRHPRVQAFWTKCPQCNEEIAEEEERLRQSYKMLVESDPSVEDRLRSMMMDESGVPPRYRNARVKDWVSNNPAMEKVGKTLQTYIERFDIALEKGKNLIFVGNPGTGKTYVACAMVNEIIFKRDHTAVYTTTQDYLVRLRACYNADAEEREMDVFNTYVAPSLLVLDEVGRHKDSKHASDSLFALLDRRYREVRPTVLISNMSKDELVAYLGEALISRLRQDGQMLGFYWEDQRK
jgi:DNA replication protein DnaC